MCVCVCVCLCLCLYLCLSLCISFLENVDRILSPDYVPTVQDILFIRWPTLGTQEHVFAVDNLHFK